MSYVIKRTKKHSLDGLLGKPTDMILIKNHMAEESSINVISGDN